MLGRLSAAWVRTLAGVAAFATIAAVAVPASAKGTGYGLNIGLPVAGVNNTYVSTQYTVTVNVTSYGTADALNANGIALYYAPQNFPSNKTAYTPEEISTQSCKPTAYTTNSSGTYASTYSCTFTVYWQDAENWYNSTVLYTGTETVHDWYVKNNIPLVEIFAAFTGLGSVSSTQGVSQQSNAVEIQDPPANNLPEVPYAVAMPVVLLAGVGGAMLIRRRRQQHS